MTATPPVPAPGPRKPRRRLLRNIALLLAALLVVWLVARPILIRQMVIPRLVLEQPTPTLKPHWKLPRDITVSSVAISPDGKTILSGGFFPAIINGNKMFSPPIPAPICMWNARTGELERTLSGHIRLVDALACSPDGKMFASSGWDGTVKLWDMATGRLLWSQPGSTSTLLFSPDSKLLADRGTLRDVATGKIVHVFNNRCWDYAGVAFSPDGKTFACVDGKNQFFNKTLAELDKIDVAHPSGIARVIGRHVQLWNVATGKLQRILPYNSTQAIVFSPDGNWLACLSEINDIPGGINGSVIRLVDAQTGAEKWTWQRRNEHSENGTFWGMTALVFSPNGKWLAGARIDHNVVLLNAMTGAFLKSLPAYEWHREGEFRLNTAALGFSQDGKTLIGRGWNTVQVWDTSSLR